MKRMRILVIGMLFLFVLSACGTAAPADSASENPQTTVEVTDGQSSDVSTDVTAEAETEATTSTDDGASASDTWSGSEFANKLDTLDSYTATFNYTTTNNGKESTWVWQQKVIREPAAMEMRTNSKSADIQAADYRMVKIADKTYSVSDDPAQCIIVVDQPQSQSLNPDSIIGNIPFAMQKTGAGPDVLGRPTDAYVYEGTEADGATYQSTALIERNEGYAMQWEVSGKTKTSDALEPFSWKYELTDINTVAPITLPKECESVGSGNKWPMPDDAQITMQTNEMMALTTAKSVNELTEFYATAMKDAGFEASDGAMNSTDSSLLPFSKDGKIITVIISQQDGKSTVIITQQ
jgi:hypothetical protein